MRNIPKKKLKLFHDTAVKVLTLNGATVIPNNKGFDATVLKAETIVGGITFTIPKEPSSIYTIYGRFEDIEIARLKFDIGVSGKYNFHFSNAPELTEMHYEDLVWAYITGMFK